MIKMENAAGEKPKDEREKILYKLPNF